MLSFRSPFRVFPLLMLLTLALTSGCKKDDTPAADKAKIEAQKKTDDDALRAYIAAQRLTATPTASGLYYVVGTPAPAGAPAPVSGQLVTVNYRGVLLDGTADGTQFDSSYPRATPYEFTIDGSYRRPIAGWNEGVQLMHKGEHGRLLIPSYLGYGPTGSGPVPPNAVLIFYMALENIQ